MNSLTDITVQKIKQLISTTERCAIITHHNPDGDAIGSSLGLYHFLRTQVAEVTVIVPNAYPDFLQWMPNNDKVLIYSENSKQATKILEAAQLIFCLDFNDLKRVGDVEPKLRPLSQPKILLDHHPFPESVFDVIISETTACATAEVVYEFMQKLNPQAIDKDVAECIFAGIMTDTGSFSFNSSNPRTYHIVAELLGYGIDKDRIHNLVYNNYSERRTRLLGYCLNEKMQLFYDFRAAYISLSKDDKQRFQFEVGDSEGFVNYPLSISGIIFSVFLIENDDHVKMSLRSRGSFDVNQFARKHFNGGGHANAAGGKSFASLAETIEQLVSLLPMYARELGES